MTFRAWIWSWRGMNWRDQRSCLFLFRARSTLKKCHTRPFASKAISWSVRFVLYIFLMNFSLLVLRLLLYWFLEALLLVDRFWLMVWIRTGLAREESVKHTFEYNATLSFLFSRLEKAFTRVVSSLILSGVTIEAHFMLKKINRDIVIFNSDYFRAYSIKNVKIALLVASKPTLPKIVSNARSY